MLLRHNDNSPLYLYSRSSHDHNIELLETVESHAVEENAYAYLHGPSAVTAQEKNAEV